MIKRAMTAILTAALSFNMAASANDDDPVALTRAADTENPDLTAAQTAIAEIKRELAAMKAEFDRAERVNLRSAPAGGAPDSLTNANGANIRVGGAFKTRYGIGWANEYRTNGGNYKTTSAGWAVPVAQLYFDIDLSRDTSGYLALRFDGNGNAGAANLVEYAYWQWKNVGGQNYKITIGLADVPFGMWGNSDIGGYNYTSLDTPMLVSPLFSNDYHHSLAALNSVNIFGRDSSTTGYGDVNLGVYTQYAWGDEELVLRAGVMASKNQTLDNQFHHLGFNDKNEYRSFGFTDHVIALAYNPSWLDGLHLELSYLGRLDNGKGYAEGFDLTKMAEAGIIVATDTTARGDILALGHGDYSYTPEIALGGSYKISDALKIYAEGLIQWQPAYISGRAYGAILGADYQISDKLLIGASGELMVYEFDRFREAPQIMPLDSINWYRLNFGARYLFGNGIYAKAQYYHDFYHAAGANDGHWKDADAIAIETGYEF